LRDSSHRHRTIDHRALPTIGHCKQEFKLDGLENVIASHASERSIRRHDIRFAKIADP